MAEARRNSFVVYYEPAVRGSKDGHQLSFHRRGRTPRLREAFFDGETWWWRRYTLKSRPWWWHRNTRKSRPWVGPVVDVSAWQSGTPWVDGPPAHWEVDHAHRAVRGRPRSSP